MKNVVFRDVTSCSSCKNRRFRGVLSSLIVFALKMEAICSSKMPVLTRATRQHNPEDDVLHT
jgi:hypothetical protein